MSKSDYRYNSLNFLLIGLAAGWLLIYVFASQASAEDPFKAPEPSFNKEDFIESAKREKILKIGLVDCVVYALQKNPEVKIAKIAPVIGLDDKRIAEAEFEPTFKIDASVDDTKEQANSTVFASGVSTSRSTGVSAGVEGKLITGTKYNLDYYSLKHKSNYPTQVINPYHSSEAVITLTQPLFRGAGVFVNRAEIVIASNNQARSEEELFDIAMDTVVNAKIAYYDLAFYRERYRIAKIFLEWTQKLLEINKARYAKGLVSSVDVLEVESSVAEREKELIDYEAKVERAEDVLKYVTNIVEDPKLWNARIELMDVPEFRTEEVELVQSLVNAFQYRPDYISKQIELKNKNIRVKVAKNTLLPTVDVIGSFGLNGLGENYQKGIREMDDGDYRDWSLGVKIEIPWGGEERADYDKKKLERARAILEFKRLEQKIILDIRDKVRDVKVQHRQVGASKVAQDSETQNYDAQSKRYAAGYVSTHDLLDYRFNLASAELDYVKAIIDYNIDLVRLERAQGLTLVKNGIAMEEE
ncbi:MAG: TolC family protein [Candidatus Omnitrophica bacterium]|nr:TolC family protein [Candidatus Omnitrophota bacterium]MDD5429625.1 TolC family protein [Candidatus Omnitrophota bacterium]